MENPNSSSLCKPLCGGKITIDPEFFDLVVPELIRMGKMTESGRAEIQAALERGGIKEAANVFMRILKPVS